MSTAVTLLLAGWGVAAALQLGLWTIQLRTRNAGIVDVGWAGAFAIVVVVWLGVTDRARGDVLLAVAMPALWSLRLTVHLLRRGAAWGTEEGRYAELRRRWAPHANRSFAVFFQAQALLVGVLAIALVWPFVAAPRAGLVGEVPRVVGACLWLVGLVGEAVADAQLDAFKRAQHGHGAVCDVGLWRYSRHPNYFFEILVWVGLATCASAYPWGLLAWISPAFIALSILTVTGVPATEAQALRSKGDAYRRYQARTSMLVPWPPSESA